MKNVENIFDSKDFKDKNIINKDDTISEIYDNEDISLKKQKNNKNKAINKTRKR